jgi:RNA polymerase sigma-70 factor (ECF subfamily)
VAEDSRFKELLTRVRAGDGQAAEELFRDYEAQVRRIVRVRLTDPRLRREIESVDVCQSVMANFFVRAALGQFELTSADDLIKLLATMARNKLLNHVEQRHAMRRDVRRLERLPVDEMPIDGGGETPSQIVANRELLAEFRSRLSQQERYIADQRRLGKGWGELAEELGATPDGLRVGFGRAIDRVSQELGLESLIHE